MTKAIELLVVIALVTTLVYSMKFIFKDDRKQLECPNTQVQEQ